MVLNDGERWQKIARGGKGWWTKMNSSTPALPVVSFFLMFNVRRFTYPFAPFSELVKGIHLLELRWAWSCHRCPLKTFGTCIAYCSNISYLVRDFWVCYPPSPPSIKNPSYESACYLKLDQHKQNYFSNKLLSSKRRLKTKVISLQRKGKLIFYSMVSER